MKSVFKGRWGFYACSYETYLRLKYLHKCYYQALKSNAAFERWYRKEPQNRVIRRWIRDEQRRKIGFEIVGPAPEPKYCPYFDLGLKVNGTRILLGDFVGDYQNARHPQNGEELVKPLCYSLDTINQFYFATKKWHEGE